MKRGGGPQQQMAVSGRGPVKHQQWGLAPEAEADVNRSVRHQGYFRGTQLGRNCQRSMTTTRTCLQTGFNFSLLGGINVVLLQYVQLDHWMSRNAVWKYNMME